VKNLIEFVAKAFVEHPDEVEVTETEDRRLELVVADSDLGRVIGRRGKTAKAIRTVLEAASAGSPGGTYELEIGSPGEGEDEGDEADEADEADSD
jgi:predicted RNA-binding protein YlqC (UPF0109 family)